ncbi:hypothetical protein HYV64_04875 [Candidatus Shapirobacteria bacterium]|nr:hypothetical protein [Candidatus Shapirobacteria bacterium]
MNVPARRNTNWLAIILGGLLTLCLLCVLPGMAYTSWNIGNSQPAASVTQIPAEAPELHKPAEFQTITVNSKEYGTDFTDRLTFTNGEILTGHVAPYEGTELDNIQHTWVDYNVEVPEGTAYAVAFGYSVKINGKEYQPGAIIMLPTDGGTVKVSILDGELVFWRDLTAMHDDISDRISTEIANGNLSIDGPLAFSFCSQEFTGYVPRELLEANKVQIVK